MALPLRLVGALAATALLAGCGPQPSTRSQPEATTAHPTTSDTQPRTPEQGSGTGATTPEVTLLFRVEKDAVSIRPGGEARVKLLSVPKGEELMVTVEPPDSRLNAVADKDVLSIRAGDKATGESVVTVKAGKESARVTVRVEGEK